MTVTNRYKLECFEVIDIAQNFPVEDGLVERRCNGTAPKSAMGLPFRNHAPPSCKAQQTHEVSMESLDHVTMLDRHQVARRLGIGVWTFGKMVKSGRFPRAVEVGPNAFRWSVATLSAWIDKKAREPRRPRMLQGRAAPLARPLPKIVRVRL